MKLLVVTQSVDKDDENLGAFYYWWEKMAAQVDELTIIAGKIGTVDLPENVHLHSLGKEEGTGRFGRIWKFLELFSRAYAANDAVLFHQIPEFVIAAAPFTVSLKRPRALWYAHGAVTRRLKIAERLVDVVVTSSREGFRLPSKKVHYVGQAINTELFAPASDHLREQFNEELRMISIGRISPIKRYEMLIEACAIGRDLWKTPWSLRIVGGPLRQGDDEYLSALKRMALEKDLMRHVTFEGPQPFSKIPELLQHHDIFLNVSNTGSLDKAVFEAMATGLSVLTSNEAYRRILPGIYFLDKPSPEAIAQRISTLVSDERPNMALREIVTELHSLEKTTGRILLLLREQVEQSKKK